MASSIALSTARGSAVAAGRILNPLAGRNQIEGAVVMGIGMAFFEETAYDPRNGSPINASLADYIVAANADVPALEVHFLEHPDLNLNELGARGIGEIADQVVVGRDPDTVEAVP